MFLQVAKLKIKSQIEPRTIRREELPEEYESLWHATTALDRVRQEGLRSRKERESDQMGLGDFGRGTDYPYVSLTRNRDTADNIAGLLRDVSQIAKATNREEAFRIAEELAHSIANISGIEDKWGQVLMGARKSLASSIMGRNPDEEIVPGMTVIQAILKGYVKGDMETSKSLGLPLYGIGMVKHTDLPEGFIPTGEMRNAKNEALTARYIYPYDRSLDRYDSYSASPINYYRNLRMFIEFAGGKMDPLLADPRLEDFINLDPEQIGVLEMLTTGDPAENTHSLDEWRGYPQDTRVIVD